jgi:predicted O-methyltransferase YrrM
MTVQIIDGLRILRMTRDDMATFKKTIRRHAPEGGRYLEIGTGEGGSAIFAHILRPDLEITTVDSFDRKNSGYYVAKYEMAKKCLSKYPPIRLVVADTREAFEDERLKDFDVIFIDGGHHYEHVLFDITHWPKRLKPGGIFFGHDYNKYHKDIVRAINEVFGGAYVARDYWCTKGQGHSMWCTKQVGPFEEKLCLNMAN